MVMFHQLMSVRPTPLQSTRSMALNAMAVEFEWFTYLFYCSFVQQGLMITSHEYLSVYYTYVSVSTCAFVCLRVGGNSAANHGNSQGDFPLHPVASHDWKGILPV